MERTLTRRRRALSGLALMLTLALLAGSALQALADHVPPPGPVPAGSGNLEGTETVQEEAFTGSFCFEATRSVFTLHGVGTVAGRTGTGDEVFYRAQIGAGQTLYGDGPLQLEVENAATYYHGPFGTHGTADRSCGPATAGEPVPAEFHLFAPDHVYRLDGSGNQVPCVGQGQFARTASTDDPNWRAEWALAADCTVVGNDAGTPGTGVSKAGTTLLHHGVHEACFEPPCLDNIRIDYAQYPPPPGFAVRLFGPTSAVVGDSVTVTARVTDDGIPVPDATVSFAASGPGPSVPPGGAAVTDATGRASFTFTAAVAGDYTLEATATDAGRTATGSYTLIFIPPPPPTVTVDGPTTGQTDESLTVVATFTNGGDPAPGASVDFAITGPGQATPASGSGLTDANGQAPFSFAADRAGDYTVTATASLPTGERASGNHTVHLDINTFYRVGSIALADGETRPEGAVVDPAGRYAYFGMNAGLKVVKIDLTTFQRVGAISTGTASPWSAVIDPAGRYAYFGTSNSVIKVDLETFRLVGTLSLPAEERLLRTAVIDPAGAYAYFGTWDSTQPRRVVKIDLATFQRVGAAVLDPDDGLLDSAVIDPAGAYAYFGARGGSGPARVVKVDLARLQRVGSVTLTGADESILLSAVVDPVGRYAYFGTHSTPGRVVKVDLATLQRVGAIVLPSPSERQLETAVIDPAGRYAYFSSEGAVETRTSPRGPAVVVKIDLVTFERAYAITLDADDDFPRSAVIDPAGDFVYFGTQGTGTLPPPAHVVKVAVRRPPAPWLVANPDAHATPYVTPLSVPAPGVLANDADTGDGDPLVAGQASDPPHGTVTLAPDGGFTYTPDEGFAGTDTLTYTASDGKDYSAPATVSVAVSAPTEGVSAVRASAFGYHADEISFFGGAQPDTGPTPAVALAANASNSPQAASDDTGLVVYGPAYLFTADRIDVTATGSLGTAGSVRTTTDIDNVNKATTQPGTGAEILTADNIHSTCTASASGTTGSTTITGGVLQVDSGWDDGDLIYPEPGEHDPVYVTLPANPAPNTTYTGHIHLDGAGATDDFRVVLNEHAVAADGTRTVRAVHEYLGIAPPDVLVGHLVLGQAVCGVEVTTTTTTTSTTTTTVPTTTTTAPKGKGGGPKATTTTTTPPSPPADLSVAVSDSPDPVKVNGEVTYTIVVANAGPNPVSGVSLALTLDGTTFVSSSGATCAAGKGKAAGLRCDLGSLASGASATVTVVAKAPAKPATVSAIASVTATATDPNPADNTDSEATTVVK